MNERPKTKWMGLIWAGLCSFFVVVSFLLVSGKKGAGPVLDLVWPIGFGCIFLCLIWFLVVNWKQFMAEDDDDWLYEDDEDADDGK